MKRTQLLLFLALVANILLAGTDGYEYKFRLQLKDKGDTDYSVSRPEEFLSKKAIDRRKRQNIAVDYSDLPISQDYINQIEDLETTIVARSKWMQTISIHCKDSLYIEQLKRLPFVDEVTCVWKGRNKSDTGHKVNDDSLMRMTVPKGEFLPLQRVDTTKYPSYYAHGNDNIRLVNGQLLHEAGFKGNGIDIAVIDAGFINLPWIEDLKDTKLKGYKNFIYQGGSLFVRTSNHGLNVLSCMAANKPYRFVGTAPEANYLLLVSEDISGEYPIEEDYWAAAVEYADSLGVDVVNTSLGYNRFDAPAISFTQSQLDGKTALISRAADMAVNKGMFVVCSAGNSGTSDWRKLTPPADARHVLTVGAVNRDSQVSKFSSRGFTADLRVKPDVVGLGERASVILETGMLGYKDGTSFSTPIIGGLAACLWQAYPQLTSKELLRVMRQSSNKYNLPDDAYGYGLPDMGKAMYMAAELTKMKNK